MTNTKPKVLAIVANRESALGQESAKSLSLSKSSKKTKAKAAKDKSPVSTEERVDAPPLQECSDTWERVELDVDNTEFDDRDDKESNVELTEDDVRYLNSLTEDDVKYLSTLSTECSTEGSEKRYLQNYEALAELRKKKDIYDKIAVLSSGVFGGSVAAMQPGALCLSGAVLAVVAELSRPLTRLISIVEMLLEHFGDDGITLTPIVETEVGKIDLLVKMPDRRTFALVLRSKGDSVVRWQAESNNFFIRARKNGGSRKNQVYEELMKSARKLNEAAASLKKEKSILLGVSNTERNKPVAKAIVLTSKTKIDPNSDPALLVDFGRAKVLHAKSDCSVYVVDRVDLVNFLLPPEKNEPNG